MKIIIDIPDEVYESVQNGTYCGSLYEELKKAVEPKQGEWEYLKEHIIELRDADGELNQKQTCQFILNLMDVIEEEGDEEIESQEDKKTKKCPNCGSDLMEYCYICGYEGEEVKE